MKKQVERFKKGFYRPVSMPIWKWTIVILAWVIATLFYCSSLVLSMTWLVLIGMLFQFIAFCLMLFMDTGNWKETEEGRRYLQKYYKNNKDSL